MLELALAGALSGCGAGSVAAGSSSGDAPPGAPTTGSSTSTSDPGSTSVGSSGPGTTSSADTTSTGPSGPPDHVPPGFLNPNDGGGVSIHCSLWNEDCPPGEKCMPYANAGGQSWNATRCVPIAPDPAQPGEPCTVEGSGVSGFDTCDFHSMCWDVNVETLEGTCVAMCIGTESAPACAEADHYCSVNAEGTLTLCLPFCDPLAQDCEAGDACYAVSGGYLCAPDASGEGGTPYSPCEFLNGCDPGSICEPSPGCAGSSRCCVPYCSLSEPDCPATTACIPVFEPGDEPVGLGDAGYCGGEP